MATLSLRRKLCREILNRTSISRGVRHTRRLSTKPPVKNVDQAIRTHKGDNVHALESESGLSSFKWMSQFGPEFLIRGEQVQVITEPDQFYQVLKLKTRKAKRRVTLASLYLGNGNLESDLVACVREACEEAVTSGNSDFEVNVLLDYTRGSRGKFNSRSMLRPLMADYKSVQVALFHTPDLRGILKRLVPDRFNETIGLTHVKLYLFDDSFIISGANLSNDYFMNRQDRYILFNDCPELANFFNDLVKAIMSFSLSLSADDSLSLAPDWDIHPYQDSDNGLRFKLAARKKIQSCLRLGESVTDIRKRDRQKVREENVADGQSSGTLPPDTAVYPLVQMGPLGVSYDEQAMLGLLRSSQPQDNILLASGYFNLTDHYMAVILDQSQAKFSILMASPQANGFLGAKGIAGAIPYSYIYLAHQFLRKVQSRQQLPRIHMMEYSRDSWTFHGKGLWYYLPGHALPSLTLVGSPNFGYRSVYRDLECQVAIVTENKGLQEQLREEHVNMYSSSSPVTEATFHRRDRHVPLWTRLVTSVIKHFF
ncbi:CDP-diacylglycerol--glycerol-3-phosphate 3-phosphatidyltransferase, mitochondrial [Aplysia californica]|uniref:CDP-diacylglycerol--glycerol-3-phosphate 3-phosphatidyltransferase n=1 Tax=Aplysia californica TaxID=6500 RepID=A0ABM0JNC5_APLCA|nr:CDP-diacylglycerol--glycerol-3-phosphate 3-phosphatidyltransferase, mitochondrial [Aplysia californica]